MDSYIEKLKENLPKKPIVITVGNYKGGAGKTTNVTLISYSLARMGIKTLVVDMDPQSNATKSLMLTRSANEEKELSGINKTLMAAIQEQNFNDLAVEIIDNLYLLPSFIDFADFPKYLYQNFASEKDQDYVFKNLLDTIKDDYQIILLDTPPMNREVTRNSAIASDYVLVSLQTQEKSLTGAENYIKQLNELMSLYKLDLDILGFLQVLFKNHGTVDTYIMESAKELFEPENIFKTVVPQMERIKRFDINGITDADMHDKKVLKLYKTVTTEFLERLEELEEEKRLDKLEEENDGK